MNLIEKKEYNETINYVETTQPDIVAEYIESLNQKLAEKEKETRHKVCEEIRKLEIRHRYDGDTNSVIDGYFVDKEILDQIEQGEIK